MRIGIIGGGAAGFFAAISAASINPNAEISILEKSDKVLSKVKISGGGRCNVTNATFENYHLIKSYPRGAKELRKAFDRFSVKDTIQWFKERGVNLKTEDDRRIFPTTDDSQTIIDCFLNECKKLKIKILYNHGIKKIILPINKESGFTLITLHNLELTFDKILIATGGHPNINSYNWIAETAHTIIPPVPSLFTFNLTEKKFSELQGISVSDATVRITGSKETQRGPVLITHWGLSGPAVLKLSAWEARSLSNVNYNFSAMISWIPINDEESLREILQQYKVEFPKKSIASNPMFQLPKRLWERLLEHSEISEQLKWGDLPNKNLNKLLENLIRNIVVIKGKTTFKDEFVTCGGINLKEVNFNTMESRICKDLFFAGEVLDIDGITGGFNFQASWTTGFIAGTSIAQNKE